MTKRLVSTVVALSAGMLVSSCALEQPTPGCIVQDAENWYARYYLKEGQDLTASCREKLASFTGELLGVFKYTDPKNPVDSKIALRPMRVTQNVPPDAEQSASHNAVGALPQEPDAENLCLATNMQTANVTVQGGTGPGSISYRFENVKVYSAPSAPGTQIGGELTYTVDECTAQYTFRAIWPFVPCSPNSNDPADSCGAGSGLNPDFNVACDADAANTAVNEYLSELEGEDVELEGVCVAADPIPSFKKQQ